jgi:hypothetical protein
MSIGDVRPQDSNDQPQEPTQNDTTPHTHGLDQDNLEKKMNTMIKFKRRASIKGEMRIMGIREKHHHTHECATMFKEIPPSTTYLVISKIG